MYKKLLKVNKKVKTPKDPKMKIPPLDPEGAAGVGFNQMMVAPKKGTFLPPKIYDNTFGMKSESLVDGSEFKAEFSKSKKQRLLEQTDELSGEASKLGYTPKVEVHDDKEVKIGLVFDNPAQMTIGGAANIGMEVKEPSIFKSAKTLKSMSEDSFDGGKPELKGEVPPIVDDPVTADTIENTSDNASDFI